MVHLECINARMVHLECINARMVHLECINARMVQLECINARMVHLECINARMVHLGVSTCTYGSPGMYQRTYGSPGIMSTHVWFTWVYQRTYGSPMECINTYGSPYQHTYGSPGVYQHTYGSPGMCINARMVHLGINTHMVHLECIVWNTYGSPGVYQHLHMVHLECINARMVHLECINARMVHLECINARMVHLECINARQDLISSPLHLGNLTSGRAFEKSTPRLVHDSIIKQPSTADARGMATETNLHSLLFLLLLVAGLSYMAYLVLLLTEDRWTGWVLLYPFAFVAFMVLGICCINTWEQKFPYSDDAAEQGVKLLQEV
ncbi:putative keratin-associated protein 5-10-like [Homarus americanus]|uniref:Putative keratin-associated protein 5-10-like n=1 Tax=Homarus americanus TaxID=6706 RepID=A0A8J5JBJ7_HOMAM|nr:putative keratin-associated protein 5-10-like [Homarus americanus]